MTWILLGGFGALVKERFGKIRQGDNDFGVSTVYTIAEGDYDKLMKMASIKNLLHSICYSSMMKYSPEKH